jgi:hypothetical protein
LLTEKQIEKEKQDSTRKTEQEVNAIRFARFVRGSHSIQQESTNTNDEERQNRNIKGCFWVNRYMFEALAV